MASTTEYLTFIIDLLREVDGISSKKMMGEYLLYKDGVLFGGVYDNRFLVKKTPSASLLGLAEALPYEGAKPMLFVDTDDADDVNIIVSIVLEDLTNNK